MEGEYWLLGRLATILLNSTRLSAVISLVIQHVCMFSSLIDFYLCRVVVLCWELELHGKQPPESL